MLNDIKANPTNWWQSKDDYQPKYFAKVSGGKSLKLHHNKINNIKLKILRGL